MEHLNRAVNFFPQELDKTIANDKELVSTMAQYPQYAKSYVWLAVTHTDVRTWHMEKWPKVKDYLDSDFLEKISKDESEFTARCWEYHLAAVLLERGLTLKKKDWDWGPDFCIELQDGKKIWIEAVTCTRGSGEIDDVEPPPVLKPRAIYSETRGIEETNRTRALRITSVIGSKMEKFSEYLKDKIVSPKDYLIIAVNGREVQHHSSAAALFKYAVFGQGPEVLVRVPGEDKFKSGYYKPVATLSYSNGEKELPPHFMEMDEFAHIGAVIYCGDGVHTTLWNEKRMGDNFFFAHHVSPTNPIPEGKFIFGRAVRKDVKTSIISDSPQI